MNRLLALAGALALFLSLLLPAGSGAQSYSAKRPASIPHYNWRTMTVSETVAAQKHLISLDRTAIRVWVNSRWTRLSANVSIASPSRLAKPMPPEILWRQKQLGWLARELRERVGRRPAFHGGVPSWFWNQALCVHSHEGAWNDRGAFRGGMQFLYSTWSSVGGTGDPADASPAEQIYRAYLVWRRDGGSWQEWPNTARMCGLL